MSALEVPIVRCLTEIFPGVDRQVSFKAFKSYLDAGYAHAVVTTKPLDVHKIAVAGYLDKIVCGVSLLMTDEGDDVKFYGIRHDFQGKGFSRTLAFATFAYLYDAGCSMPELNADLDAVDYWDALGMKICGDPVSVGDHAQIGAQTVPMVGHWQEILRNVLRKKLRGHAYVVLPSHDGKPLRVVPFDPPKNLALELTLDSRIAELERHIQAGLASKLKQRRKYTRTKSRIAELEQRLADQQTQHDQATAAGGGELAVIADPTSEENSASGELEFAGIKENNYLDEGYTPLYLLVYRVRSQETTEEKRRASLQRLHLFLSIGADPARAASGIGFTPLIFACCYIPETDDLRNHGTAEDVLKYRTVKDAIDLDLVEMLLEYKPVRDTVNDTDARGKTALYRAMFGYSVLGISACSYINVNCVPVVQRLLGAGACPLTDDTIQKVSELVCYRDKGVWHPCKEGFKMELLHLLNGSTGEPVHAEITDYRPHASAVRRQFLIADQMNQVSRALGLLGLEDVPTGREAENAVKQVAKDVLKRGALPSDSVDWARKVLIQSIREHNERHAEQRAAAERQAAGAAVGNRQVAAAAAIGDQSAGAAAASDGLALLMNAEPAADAMTGPAEVKKKVGQDCEGECGNSWKDVHGRQARSNRPLVMGGRQRWRDLLYLRSTASPNQSQVVNCDKLKDQSIDTQARKLSDGERANAGEVQKGSDGKAAPPWVCPDCYVRGVDLWFQSAAAAAASSSTDMDEAD